ncbi:MAG: transporter substrate-binding domain-containing protein [Spirochaetes bacterium]|mgnify:CR=1 FL=1|uniref:Transporter substrate-binding domain-containing protein n=1 Tax=Candidatus Ornithospirochaeta stercoravium TaxID=2840897 RepID=A0A9D9NC33_9SPIO|nr:transporter substrate-binding domain-containing protein [Candidatus Ornithospirochaeta stercoravium]
MKKFCLLFAVFIMLSSFVFAESEFTEIEDLNGHNIGVQTAVLYEELIQDRVPDSTIQYYTMPNDMILALKSGKVDAYLIEEVSYGVQKKNHPDLAVLEEPAGYINATCIIGNNERQGRLLAELNAFIAESHANGLLAELYDYWIADFDPVNDTCDITGFTGENGTIAVAVEGGYEPFSFISNGNISGFDVDFICRFARAYGYTPEFYEVPFEAIAPGVESGKYDIGMNIVVSEERNETGTLSDVYYSTPIRLVILGEDESGLTFFQQLAQSFEKTFLRESRWILFVQGAGVTVLITITSILAGTILGFIIFMLCRKGNKIMNKGTNVFLWLIHGMPTVLLLMILYYIVFGSSSLSGTWVSVVGFSLMFACSMIDMLRVGCNAIGRGQFEASRALGYSEHQSFFKIILPQAAQHFLPIYRNDVVTLIKETSVVGYIAVLDLTKISDLVRSRTYEAFFPLIVTAIMYFVISAILTRLVTLVENAIDPKRRKKDKILKGIKEIE